MAFVTSAAAGPEKRSHAKAARHAMLLCNESVPQHASHRILDWKDTGTIYWTGRIGAPHTRPERYGHYILDWKDTGTTS